MTSTDSVIAPSGSYSHFLRSGHESTHPPQIKFVQNQGRSKLPCTHPGGTLLDALSTADWQVEKQVCKSPGTAAHLPAKRLRVEFLIWRQQLLHSSSRKVHGPHIPAALGAPGLPGEHNSRIMSNR